MPISFYQSKELLRESFLSDARLALKLSSDDTCPTIDSKPGRYIKPIPLPGLRQKSTTASLSATKGAASSRFFGLSAISESSEVSISPVVTQGGSVRNIVGAFERLTHSEGNKQKSQVKAACPAPSLFLRRPVQSVKRHECVACQTSIAQTSIRMPCGHYYDSACLVELIKTSVRDESLFPPRCCKQEVPSTTFEPYIGAELSTLVSEKRTEFTTPKRVYCANPSCGRFLGPRNKAAHHVYTCPAPTCSTRTCSRCCSEVKGHVLHGCRVDTPNRQLLELKDKAGWAQCPGCDRMIELQSGCNHVTCVCKTEFCYHCGSSPWKICSCPLWEEGRIITAIPSVRSAPVLPPVPRHDRVRDTWLHPPKGNQPAQEGITVSVAVRRERFSAPAQLQAQIPFQESIVLRGIQAQERRSKPKPPESSIHIRSVHLRTVSRPTTNARLDALDEQIDRLLRIVDR